MWSLTTDLPSCASATADVRVQSNSAALLANRTKIFLTIFLYMVVLQKSFPHGRDRVPVAKSKWLLGRTCFEDFHDLEELPQTHRTYNERKSENKYNFFIDFISKYLRRRRMRAEYPLRARRERDSRLPERHGTARRNRLLLVTGQRARRREPIGDLLAENLQKSLRGLGKPLVLAKDDVHRISNPKFRDFPGLDQARAHLGVDNRSRDERHTVTADDRGFDGFPRTHRHRLLDDHVSLFDDSFYEGGTDAGGLQ